MISRERLPAEEDHATRRARERVGHVLRDRWRLDELLAVSKKTAVYAGTHRIGKRVAVKILHAELSRSAEARQQFIDEGYAANRVGHPGVASILDDDIAEDGAAFLVTDLFEGETLDVRIAKKGTLEALELLTLMDGLLDILAAAHANGIVHLSIEPGNILVTHGGVVKLLDFELAPRTDVWAVGATMFLALTGRQVRGAEAIGDAAPHLPLPLVALVDKALACDPSERWPNAAAMQSALRDVRARLSDQRPSLEEFRLPVRRYGRHALAFGGVLLVASIVWFGRVHRPQSARSAQPVLVPAVHPEPKSEVPPLLAVEPNGSESEPFSPRNAVDAPRTTRKHGGRLRPSLPKVTTQPAEVTAASTSPATSGDVATASMWLATRTSPTRQPSTLLSDFLDRRK
jgi:serine/threonine-protein kinase